MGDGKIQPVEAVLSALAYAALKHRDQRRKGADASPFINHAIDVADLLARVGGVSDPATLQAAILHDTLEDTATTAAEIETHFGPKVRRIVEEVTDDKRLSREERRRLQAESARHLSLAAKQIRLADKISNVRAVCNAPPTDWSVERRRDYVEWTEQVVQGCRGTCQPLERLYDEALNQARLALAAQAYEADTSANPDRSARSPG
jgi:(p)ppGpp synthase/HD superfamily hydrolase